MNHSWRRFRALLFSILLGISLAPLPVYALKGLDDPRLQNLGLAKYRDFPTLLEAIITILLGVAGSVAVVFLIVGGFRYIAAHGSETETEAAKKTLSSALIGLVIVILAYAIVRVVANAVLGPGASGVQP